MGLKEILAALPDQANRAIYAELLAAIVNQGNDDAEIDIILDGSTLTSLTNRKWCMDLADGEALAFQLSRQLAVLEARGSTLFFWQPSDLSILTLKGSGKKTTYLYFLTNLAQLVPLYKKDSSQLVLVYPTVYPFPENRCAPELLKMSVLPFITHRSASYYSLGLLCLELLALGSASAALGSASAALGSLDALRGTKLFYFLERCLHTEPSERRCFYLL
jgi:hypothetical protein